jgi:pimeloyl-ACP methyl ester carboxylesterase
VLAVLTSFDGGRLFGQLYGTSGPRVLALHGWRRDHRDFAAVLSGVAPKPTGTPLERVAADPELPGEPLNAIALDLPGFGATPEPEGSWGSDEYAAAVAQVISEMAAPVVVLGHSFGGRVAVKLAAAHPAQVAGVLLTGAPLFPADPGARRRPPLKLRLARQAAKTGLVSEERLEALRQRYGSADYREASPRMRGVLVQALREERESAYSAALRAISCPVELVWGELDTAAPPRVARQIVADLEAPSNLVICPGVGHLTPLLVPGELRAALERLLSTVVDR